MVNRIYYACGYRTASGAIVDRQFVLYTNGEKNFIEIFELKYNYEMLRDFVQHNLNVDLEESYIQTLLAKYKAIESEDKRKSKFFFNYTKLQPFQINIVQYLDDLKSN